MAYQQPTDPKPHWQLPPGVTRGLWDYVHNEMVADDYDDYFAFNKLFEFDEQVLLKYFQSTDESSQSVVADLGCGTGRALLPLVRRGFAGLAIDLSENMLKIVEDKAEEESLNVDCICANLVELDCVGRDSVDYAMCLFSTLGMIRGKTNRQQALAHVRRILKPGGLFVLHVHNYWYNLYDPGGPLWLASNLVRSLFDREIERGDKFFPYRGVPRMFLHVFTRNELIRTLRKAGFDIVEIIPLDPQRFQSLRLPWLCGSMRANGWIAVCR